VRDKVGFAAQYKAIQAALLATAGAFLSACALGSGSGYQLLPGSMPMGQYQSSGVSSAQFNNSFFSSTANSQDHIQGPLDSMSDQELSDRITGYLHRNLLPLVQANVQRDPSGQRKIVLSGFVASSYGKNDAVTKVMSYLNNPGWPVSNYIRISPDLADLNAQYRQTHQAQTQDNSSSLGGNPDNGAGSANSWSNPSAALNAQQLPPGAQAYLQQQQQAAQAMPMMPMMPMGGMMFGGPGFGIGGGTMGFGTGFGGPFGGFGMMPGFGFFP